MLVKKAIFLLALLCVNISFGHTTQRPSRKNAGAEDDSNPLLDMASMFIQEALNNQNGNGGGNGAGAGAGLAGVASLIGTFMQANSGGAQGKSSASGAMQILSGIGSLLANSAGNNGRSGGGFDPSIIGNVLEMFTNSEADADDAEGHGTTRSKQGADSGIGLDSILQIASVFMNSNSKPQQKHHQQKRAASDASSDNMINQQHDDDEPDEGGLMSLLPLVMQAVSSFAGPEGQHTQEKHKSHAWVLPPFLEHIHVLWDHFSNSDLADALYAKSGINKILQVGTFDGLVALLRIITNAN